MQLVAGSLHKLPGAFQRMADRPGPAHDGADLLDMLALSGLDRLAEELLVFLRRFTKGVDVRQGQAAADEIVAEALVRFRVVFQIVDGVVRDLERGAEQAAVVDQVPDALIACLLKAEGRGEFLQCDFCSRAAICLSLISKVAVQV